MYNSAAFNRKASMNMGSLVRATELTMKIRINKAACVGNARCWAVSEELFPLDDDGYIEVEEVDVPPGMEALARRGARACPERVIEIIEDEK
jgi:ferredoxin